ncbi:MAG: histidine phosphatase family protein [Planctomycetota bacterium]|jgi:broad specificity phosphatase PhoE
MERAASDTPGPIGPPPHLAGPRPGPGRGARVWLARHAQVHEDWATRSYGPEDVPLSAEGERRTVELGASLARVAPDALLSSDLSRASRLADVVTEHVDVPVQLDERLREVDRGDWRGLDIGELHATRTAEVGRFYDDPWTYDGHGGECDRDVAMRAWPVFEEALAGVDGGVLVLTAHYNVIRVLATVALGIPPERSFAFRLDKGRVTLLEDTDRGFRLIAHNLHDPGAFEHTDEYLGLNPAQSGPKH